MSNASPARPRADRRHGVRRRPGSGRAELQPGRPGQDSRWQFRLCQLRSGASAALCQPRRRHHRHGRRHQGGDHARSGGPAHPREPDPQPWRQPLGHGQRDQFRPRARRPHRRGAGRHPHAPEAGRRLFRSVHRPGRGDERRIRRCRPGRPQDLEGCRLHRHRRRAGIWRFGRSGQGLRQCRKPKPHRRHRHEDQGGSGALSAGRLQGSVRPGLRRQCGRADRRLRQSASPR